MYKYVYTHMSINIHINPSAFIWYQYPKSQYLRGFHNIIYGIVKELEFLIITYKTLFPKEVIYKKKVIKIVTDVYIVLEG